MRSGSLPGEPKGPNAQPEKVSFSAGLGGGECGSDWNYAEGGRA